MDNKEVKAVRDLVTNYMQSTFQADIPRLKKCFHPQAVMNGFLMDKKLFGSPEPFFQDIGGHPSMAQSNAPYHGEITSIAVAGNVASVTLKETGFAGEFNFINYLHLVKENGQGWSIISKTFTSV